MGSLELVRLERPGLAELDELAAYDEEAFGHTGLRSFDIGVVSRAGAVFLGQVDGVVVGSCQLLRTWDEPGAFWVFGFYVRPDWQRQGFGREMLRGVIEEVLRAGGSGIALSVAVANRPALDLYLSFGFRIVEEIADFYGPGEDRYLLRWDSDTEKGEAARHA